jgi:hypothetical protein
MWASRSGRVRQVTLVMCYTPVEWVTMKPSYHIGELLRQTGTGSSLDVIQMVLNREGKIVLTITVGERVTSSFLKKIYEIWGLNC